MRTIWGDMDYGRWRRNYHVQPERLLTEKKIMGTYSQIKSRLENRLFFLNYKNILENLKLHYIKVVINEHDFQKCYNSRIISQTLWEMKEHQINTNK